MLPVVTDVSELYKTADGGAMATLIAKLAIEKSYSSKLEETRNAIQACNHQPMLCCLPLAPPVVMWQMMPPGSCKLLRTSLIWCP